MATDIYSALVGGVPTDQDSQQALAEALRRQSILGAIGQASGAPGIADAGASLYKSANAQAAQLGSDRRAQVNEQRQADQLAWERQHQQAQLDWEQKHGGDELGLQRAQLAETTRKDTMTDQRDRDLLAEKDADAQKLAAEKLAAKAAGKPLPTGADKDVEQIMDSTRGVDQTLASALALDKQGVQLGGMGRGLKNAISANTPFGTAAMDQDQNFWAQYNRNFTLPEMKSTIGVRHNEYMQHLFESYHINPNMTNQQIIQNLQQISAQNHQKVASRAKDLTSQGYNIGALADQEGDFALPLPGTKDSELSPKARSYLNQVDQPPPQPQPQAMPQPQQGPQSAMFPQALQQPQQPSQTPLNMFSGLYQ